MFEIRFSPSAFKFFKKLKDKKLKELFKNAINEISKNPYIGEPKKGDLTGIYGYDVYYHGTNYEIAYVIKSYDAENIVIIIMAGTRKNFYNQLKNYWL